MFFFRNRFPDKQHFFFLSVPVTCKEAVIQGQPEAKADVPGPSHASAKASRVLGLPGADFPKTDPYDC